MKDVMVDLIMRHHILIAPLSPTPQRGIMLTEEHLRAYRITLLEASSRAHVDIKEAQDAARKVACEGCTYCAALARHQHVLDSTTNELLTVIASLRAGTRTLRTFPKKMTHEFGLYRGFITWEGEYIDLPGMEHDAYRARYIEEHGPNRGYQLISVHSSYLRNEIQFTDRKLPPTKEQYATIRELLADAQGLLSFRFMYNSNHPSLARMRT